MSESGFIPVLAQHILETFDGKTDRLDVVFPNKRAGLFLKQELMQRSNKTMWLPNISTIEEIFSRWSGYSLADPLNLTFELMQVFFEQKNQEAPDIQFAGFAAQLVREFDEIDHYLADPVKLFRHLSEAKALELWHADGSALSSYEKNYLLFYQSFELLYAQLHQKMHAKKTASYGAIARHLASLTEDALMASVGDHFTLFAGFNAFSPAEEVICTRLLKHRRAAFRWDLETFYTHDNAFGQHEAGVSWRRFHDKNPNAGSLWTGERLLAEPKEINFIAAAGQVGQAKALGARLSSDISTGNDRQTAIILADENLLTPVLGSIPGHFGHINVTMGLPYHTSQAYGLILAMIRLHQNTKERNKEVSFPLDHLMHVLDSDLLRISVDQSFGLATKLLISKLFADANNFVEKDRFVALATDTDPRLVKLAAILADIEQGNTLRQIDQLRQLFDWMLFQIKKQEIAHHRVLYYNQLVVSQRMLNQLRKLLEQYENRIEAVKLEPLLNQVAAAQSLHFVGEPLQGLQVMGLLESRNLDFECIHLLSANEGILPRDTHQQSLLPFDLRRDFGLPSRNESQAIYAFHFFRLLQHAKKINLYYNSEPGTLGSGEMSRYLLQIKHELLRLNPNIRFSETTFSYKPTPQHLKRSIRIEKNEAVKQRLMKRLEAGLSPTSISRFLNCSLQFYLKDVQNIEEAPETDASISLNQLGTVIHLALEQLFKPWLNKPLSTPVIDGLKQIAEQTLTEAYKQEFPGILLSEGMNHLNFTVALHFITNLLESEKKVASNQQLVILEQESRLTHHIDVDGVRVKVKGTIDRIDMLDDRIRIIDYKTGKVEPKEIQLKLAEDYKEGNKQKGLQLAIYTWLYMENHPGIENVPDSFLNSLAKSSLGMVKSSLPGAEHKAQFLEQIHAFLSDTARMILDDSQAFEQTEDHKKCRMCAYKSLCLRKEKK